MNGHALAHKAGPAIRVRDNGELHPLREEEVTQRYVDGINDAAVSAFLVGQNKSRETLETVRAFVRQNWNDERGILFGLFVDGRHCGNVRLHDCENGEAWLGIALFDRSIWGQGWASDAIRAVSTFAIDELNVRRVKAGIDCKNAASERAFSKAGFAPMDEDTVKADAVSRVWSFSR